MELYPRGHRCCFDQSRDRKSFYIGGSGRPSNDRSRVRPRSAHLLNAPGGVGDRGQGLDLELRHAFCVLRNMVLPPRIRTRQACRAPRVTLRGLANDIAELREAITNTPRLHRKDLMMRYAC